MPDETSEIMTTQSQPEPLCRREVAELIGCLRALAYRPMQLGVIPKSFRIPRETLVEWIRANTRGAPGRA